MATGLASFFVDIGIKGDTLTLKDMINMMSDLKIESLEQLDVLNMLKNSFKDVFSEALRHGTQLEAMKEVFGLDPKVVQNWENVAKIMSGMAAGPAMKGSMESMQSALDQIRQGHPPSGWFEGMSKIGLAGKLDGVNKAEDLAAILLSRFPAYMKEHGGTPDKDRAALGDLREFIKMAGVSNETFLRILLGGPGHFTGLASQVPTMSDQDVKNWEALNEQMNTLILKWQMFLLAFEESALPTILAFGKGSLNVVNGKTKPDLGALSMLKSGLVGTAALGVGAIVGVPATPAIGLALILAAAENIRSAGNSKKDEEALSKQIDIYFHGGEANHLAHEIADIVLGKTQAASKSQVTKASKQTAPSVVK